MSGAFNRLCKGAASVGTLSTGSIILSIYNRAGELRSAYDLYLTPEQAREIGAELIKQADHVPAANAEIGQ